ncbi:hypothetical protein AB0D78_18110 [Streptomyces avermitilis]|uniref:peptidoglycan-binding domain-containing protein n=1 Tax=Streptomyces avermitilis TaxID=33903 RepID=UPI0033F2AE5A
MRKHIRTAAVATVLAAGTALGSIAAVGTALASEDTGFVDGKAGTHDDWNDEGTLAKDDNGNAVALWQTVLWADGAKWKAKNGTLKPFTQDDITGDFNSRTVSATKFWQAGNGLKQTGKADGASFSLADNNLGSANKKGLVIYDGVIDETVQFKRLTVAGVTQQVYFVKVDDEWVAAAY